MKSDNICTPSKRAKELGCKSLAQVVKATGQSEQTLINWFKTRTVVFDACCEYVAKRNGNAAHHSAEHDPIFNTQQEG